MDFVPRERWAVVEVMEVTLLDILGRVGVCGYALCGEMSWGTEKRRER